MHIKTALIIATMSQFTTDAWAQEIVRIAHVAPTSGPIAHYGKDHENGARIAIDELNAKGVKIAGKLVKLELVSEDDAADPKQGTAVAQKLVDMHVNGVVGHLTSSTSIPASRLYSNAGIPQITPSATNPTFTRQGHKTAFRMVADDSQYGSALGRYAVSTLKAKSIAVIDDRTAYGSGMAEEFAKSVKAAGGNIVIHEFTNDKAIDFTAILTSVRGKNPDLIFFGGMDAQAGPMLRQMRGLGMSTKLAGGDGICSNELPKLAGDAMLNDQVICGMAGGVSPEETKNLEVFAGKLKQRFNADVVAYSPYVYDAVHVLVDSMIRAGSSAPAKYLPEVGRTHFQGVTGLVEFDDNGNRKNASFTLYTFRDKQRSTLGVVR